MELKNKLQKIKFETDYQEGAHPKIIERFLAANVEQNSGYGFDPHCKNAKNLIRSVIAKPEAKIFFVAGGTQTNLIVADFLLKPYEAIVCVESGHINNHEAGAIEATGHKIFAIPGKNALLDAKDLKKFLVHFYSDPACEHTAQPKIVYISHSSEFGTIYSKQMLKDIKSVCEEYNLILFLDGARLGAGLMSEAADADIKDIANLCDVFYIGGTKNGASLGEAVVFTDGRKYDLSHFRTLIKQHGGLLAKGWIVGVQFEGLFTDGLYFENAKHSNRLAMRIKKAFKEANIPFLFESFTNQQFFVLTAEQHKKLGENFDYKLWEPREDGSVVVRFTTSWATTDENVDKLINAIKNL